MAERAEMSSSAFILGILSIVFAFFQPFAALVLGIIGLMQSKKSGSQKARKFNIIGIVLSIIFIIISAVIFATSLAGNFGGLFPSF